MTDKRQYFDELAQRWDNIPKRPWAAETVALFCRRACRGNPSLVLDVGAGTGLLVPVLIDILSDSASVIEFDYALQMLRIGQEKVSNGRVGWVCGDALALPFPPAAFPAVLCYGILPHLGDATEALAKLWSVVQPGGALAVGHPLGSAALNEMHAEIGGPVGEDRLPTADEVAVICRRLGASRVETEDKAQGYFVYAEKER